MVERGNAKRAVTLHRGALFTPTGRREFRGWEDGCVAVGSDGRIAAVGDFTAVAGDYPSARVTDWRPAAILPGLVDLHSHVPQYSAVAMDGYELLPWLERFIFPAEAAFADRPRAHEEAGRFFADALATGTTAACLYVTVHEEATGAAFEAAEGAGIRACIGKVMMDRNAPAPLLEETGKSLAASERLCREWNGAAGGRLRYVFTPRFAVTCTPELMRGAAELAQAHDALIQTHLAENQDEVNLVARLFPASASYTDVYGEAGLLGARTIMAHCVLLSAGEYDLLASTRTRIAHCPSSNFFLRSGIMDMAMADQREMVVGLGSDVGAGPSLSLFKEMANACYASKALYAMERLGRSRLADLEAEFAGLPSGPELYRRVTERLGLASPARLVGPAQAFYLATLGGAEALGLADEIGSLAPGKWADFVVVDLRAVDPAFGEYSRTADEMLSQIVFRADPRAVVATHVAGRQVHASEAAVTQ